MIAALFLRPCVTTRRLHPPSHNRKAITLTPSSKGGADAVAAAAAALAATYQVWLCVVVV